MKTEHEEQREFVQWFRQNCKPMRIFAIPNGGLRNKVTAMRLKAEGLAPGVPDLFVPELKLFIEMKREKGGRLSEPQKDWRQHLENIGYVVFVAHGQEEIKKYLKKLLKIA